MKSKYNIKRILNNNAILAIDENDEELILMGKGIGFSMRDKSNYRIEDSNIEKIFIPSDSETKNQYIDVFSEVDSQIVYICNEILSIAEKTLGKMHKIVNMVLIDHLSYAIQKVNMGIKINTSLLFDVKILYPQEYLLAQRTREMVLEKLNIDLPEAENAFIAIHLNAARNKKDVKETLSYTAVVSEMISMLSLLINKNLKENNNYKFIFDFLVKWTNNIEEEVEIPNPLYSSIRNNISDYYEIARKLAIILEKKKDCTVSQGDIGFLAFYLYYSLGKED